MKNLSRLELESLVIGSSWYGTGGGLPLSRQLELIRGLQKPARIVTFSELDQNKLVACAYGVGSAESAKTELKDSFIKALQIAREFIGSEIVALFQAETNIEGEIFRLSETSNIPVLDADTTGGRAVPEIRLDNFALHGIPVTPLIAVNSKGEIRIIKEPISSATLEKEIRAMAYSGSLAILDHCITVKSAEKYLTHGVLERSLNLGRNIKEGISLEELFLNENARYILSGEVVESHLKTQNGFLQGKVLLRENSGEILELTIKNELLAIQGEKISVSCPDLLFMIDPHSLYGIHSSELHQGRKIVIASKEPEPLWATKAGRDLFSLHKCFED